MTLTLPLATAGAAGISPVEAGLQLPAGSQDKKEELACIAI